MSASPGWLLATHYYSVLTTHYYSVLVSTSHYYPLPLSTSQYYSLLTRRAAVGAEELEARGGRIWRDLERQLGQHVAAVGRDGAVARLGLGLG